MSLHVCGREDCLCHTWIVEKIVDQIPHLDISVEECNRSAQTHIIILGLEHLIRLCSDTPLTAHTGFAFSTSGALKAPCKSPAILDWSCRALSFWEAWGRAVRCLILTPSRVTTLGKKQEQYLISPGELQLCYWALKPQNETFLQTLCSTLPALKLQSDRADKLIQQSRGLKLVWFNQFLAHIEVWPLNYTENRTEIQN